MCSRCWCLTWRRSVVTIHVVAHSFRLLGLLKRTTCNSQPSQTCGHVRSSRRRWRWAQCRPRPAAPTFGRVVLASASTSAWCPVYRLSERPQPGVARSGLVSLQVVAARDQKCNTCVLFCHVLGNCNFIRCVANSIGTLFKGSAICCLQAIDANTIDCGTPWRQRRLCWTQETCMMREADGSSIN